MSYRNSEQKQKRRQGGKGRGVIKKSSWKRSITMEVRKSGVKDSGGGILGARACTGVTSAF